MSPPAPLHPWDHQPRGMNRRSSIHSPLPHPSLCVPVSVYTADVHLRSHWWLPSNSVGEKVSKDGRGEGGHLASFIRSTHVACAPTGCRSLRQALKTHCEHSSQVPAFTELTLGGRTQDTGRGTTCAPICDEGSKTRELKHTTDRNKAKNSWQASPQDVLSFTYLMLGRGETEAREVKKLPDLTAKRGCRPSSGPWNSAAQCRREKPQSEPCVQFCIS